MNSSQLLYKLDKLKTLITIEGGKLNNGKLELIRESFEFKLNPIIDNEEKFELVQFCNNIKFKSLELFGMIQLNKKMLIQGEFICFGNIELDHLCIDQSDQKIKYIDFQSSKVIDVIASNDKLFLDVIFGIYEYFIRKILQHKVDPCEEAINLAEKSGTFHESIKFYKTYLGCR